MKRIQSFIEYQLKCILNPEEDAIRWKMRTCWSFFVTPDPRIGVAIMDVFRREKLANQAAFARE